MSDGERPIRVLVAKPGLDGHDRGAKVVARALRDAGFEVIYTGLHQTPEQVVARALRDAGMEVIYTGIRQTPDMIAEAALQEDVDAIGLSIHSGAHMALFPRIMEALKARGVDDAVVFAGGIIPDDDVPAVKALGIREVFGPGASLDEIVRSVREAVAERHGAPAS